MTQRGKLKKKTSPQKITLIEQKMNTSTKTDFGATNESNQNWINLKRDFAEWELSNPNSQFVSPKKFKKIYPHYNIFSSNTFRVAYFALLDESCKCSLVLLFTVIILH